jgi:(1->4)-alpha-D-glucan 1-alpha-D-glucosylmutase
VGARAQHDNGSLERELVDRGVNSEVAESYIDVWGKPTRIDPQTRQALLNALGPQRAVSRKLSLEKGNCYQPELLEGGGRVWGFMVQLYSLRSARNWGIGDFGDLRALIETAAGLGAAVVGVNPLHAGGTSPYSPSSRHALNVLYLDIESIPEYSRCPPAQKLVRSTGFQKRLSALREAELVDYEGVARAKYEALEFLFKNFEEKKRFAEKKRSGGEKKRLEGLAEKKQEGIKTYALFEALREKFGGGWQSWPEEYRDPRSAAVLQFAKKNPKRVEFHEYLQRNARLQLDAAQARALELGMPIGLYVDLALGADAGGAEVWGDREVFALEASCGAPPDEFNPRGQDWGLPPYNPRALRARGYAPFIDLLRANMPRGGALRMDHVMALMRLWWIPRGAKAGEGGYVHYPFEDLVAVLAQQSRERRCMVIGEDLGTVSPELRKALNEAGVLSYRPLLFEKQADGEFAPPQAYPREALTCVSTHDLPTWKGFFENKDLLLREKLGLTVDVSRELQLREKDKENLKKALLREGLDISAAAAHLFIARTPCKIMLVQPEDVFELAEQVNLPGTVAEHPNWRRKLPVPVEAWAADSRVASLSRAVAPLRGVGARVPRATYRFQLNKDFRFRDAIALVPYLAALGVSHVYASPFLMARPGSAHGYDIVDHGRVNPEIGTEAELDELIAALQARGMGMVLDIVPNHMGVLRGDNAWWLDVLEKGQASPYAKFFDIDWNPAKPELRGKVLLPVLGNHYGEVLEKNELKLVKEKGAWRIAYFDHRFPLNKKSSKEINVKKISKDSLAMHRLLEQQHYRLAFWRVASDEINYRRFFEITDLAALRVEDRDVFEATHAYIARLCRRRGVDGLRVDHPDGLADPRTYFERLRELCGRCGTPWIVVEKIVASHETLPADWPVHGTTGYRFANLLTGLFVDGNAKERFDRIYRHFTGEQRSFDDIAYASRMLIMNTTLAAELDMLSTRLARIAAGNRNTRDYTRGGLRKALAEIAAHFPVYRSYITARGASDTDRRHIGWAVGKARRASYLADPSVFEFIRSLLLLEIAPKEKPRQQAMLDFAMRFQQFTAPVVAKGDEDTAFYRYHRLIALNEVGNDPREFGFSLKAFHAASEDRAKNWAHTMIASSTHDTKRSEDARARLGVLSEMASTWRLMLRRWSLMNRSARSEVAGASAPSEVTGARAPSAGDEYLYYQALLAIWPDRIPDQAALKDLHDRLQGYMLKAAREAKLRTSWINPDEEYEAALGRFVSESFRNELFLKDLNEALARLARLGMLVGLSQAVIKAASPGVPDYYQGTELWDFSLVDPDNRRPVDYALRAKLLASLDKKSFSPKGLLEELADGRAKLHVISKGLSIRQELRELFYAPAYVPLYADSGREENLCAFALQSGRQAVIAVAPRLFAGLMQEGDLAPIGARVWGESRLSLPESLSGEFVNVLTEEKHKGSSLRVADLLAVFPVALLVRRG